MNYPTQIQQSKADQQVPSGFKITISGVIPQDWKVEILKHLIQRNRGIRYGIVQPGEFDQDGRFMVRGQDYSFGWAEPETLFRVSESVESRYKNARLEEGDVIITIVGAGTGTVAIIPDWLDGANCTQTTARIAIDKNKANSEYIYHFLASSAGKRLTYKNIKGGAQPGLNCGDIEKYHLPLPRLSEQRAIADCLSTWGRAIEKLTLLIELKEQRKKGLMQQLLTGKKRLPTFAEASADKPGFSREWEEEKLGEFFKERKETGFDDLPLLSVGEAGVYPQSESNKKDTSNADKSKYKRICPGDIGYNTMRMWQGRSALSSLEGIISPAYTIVTPRKNADSQFFAYLFKLESVIHKFFRNSQGLVSDTLNCKYKDFSIVKVMLPPSLNEQVQIAQILKHADHEIELMTAQLETLRDQKKGMMQQLLTGKKRLKMTYEEK